MYLICLNTVVHIELSYCAVVLKGLSPFGTEMVCDFV